MNVAVESVGPCRKVLRIKVPSEAVAPQYDQLLAEYRKAARIPGFRQGKAPEEIVRRHYDKSIAEDTKERLLPRLYEQALVKEKMTPVAVVDVKDVVFEREKGLSFAVTVDIAPQLKLPRYRKIALKKKKVEVTGKMIDEAVNRAMDSHSRFVEASGRPARENDLVLIDYSGECDGKPLSDSAGACAELGRGKDCWILLGADEFLPGFNAGLAGASVGDERRVPVRFPPDYHVKPVAGKEAVYSVQVKGLREKKPPELTPEFFKLFRVESMDQFREKARTELAALAESDEKNRLRGEIVKNLLENSSFDVPQSVVDERTRQTARSMVADLVRIGGTEKHLEEMKDNIMATASKSAADRVKLEYLLEKIANEEKIEVEEAEISRHIEFLAGQNGMEPARLRAALAKNDGTEKLKSDLREQKTLDYVLEHARIREE